MVLTPKENLNLVWCWAGKMPVENVQHQIASLTSVESLRDLMDLALFEYRRAKDVRRWFQLAIKKLIVASVPILNSRSTRLRNSIGHAVLTTTRPISNPRLNDKMFFSSLFHRMPNILRLTMGNTFRLGDQTRWKFFRWCRDSNMWPLLWAMVYIR